MLLRFRGANHRSFRDEFELWLRSVGVRDSSERPAGLSAATSVGYLPVLTIFGANGAGKSNSLKALRWMRQAVLFSVRDWDSSAEGIGREPFALDPAARAEASLYEVDFILDGDRFVYGFEVSDTLVESEWLHAYPGGQANRQVWFERDVGAPEEFSFPGKGLRGDKISLTRQTRSNALFLTVAAAFNQPQLTRVHSWFKDNLWWVSPTDDLSARVKFTVDRLSNETYRRRVEALLKAADIGILGVVPDPLSVDGVKLLHRAKAGAVALDFGLQESTGTKHWVGFVGAMLEALDRGSVLLADELDASLHPTLMSEVLRVFRDEDANPHGAQLIAAVHDMSLLGKAHPYRALNRDEVWLVDKDTSGESTLFPLTDGKPRKDDAIDRLVLSGVLSGTPRISTGRITREVSKEVCA